MKDYLVILAAFFKKASVLAVGAILGYFEPTSKYLLITIVLVAIDVITGIAAAKKNREVISSKRMKRKITDIVWYSLAILLSYHFEDVFFSGNILKHLPLTFAISFYIAFVELKSNLENISTITGNDLWKNVAGMFEGITNPFKSNK